MDQLGQEVVDGVVHAGDSYTLESIQQRFNVSRTVARDAMRSLESLGLVLARRRVGLQVQPRSQWNVNHPRVIRLRLQGPDSAGQYRELAELRVAVEPYAAHLAALRADDATRARLRELAEALRAAGEVGDVEQFLEHDTELHSLLLAAAGNSHFLTLDAALAAVLAGRHDGGVLPFHAEAPAVADHVRLALAVADGRAQDAEAASHAVMAEIERALDQDLGHTGADGSGMLG